MNSTLLKCIRPVSTTSLHATTVISKKNIIPDLFRRNSLPPREWGGGGREGERPLEKTRNGVSLGLGQGQRRHRCEQWSTTTERSSIGRAPSGVDVTSSARGAVAARQCAMRSAATMQKKTRGREGGRTASRKENLDCSRVRVGVLTPRWDPHPVRIDGYCRTGHHIRFCRAEPTRPSSFPYLRSTTRLC
ncbi:hypothetical protein C4D60_Mb08t07020 [Musa balbisiana]|uniref:Uncharacterized protein n=1 Tax=Musa balbisiana TaxID=52838 RepID=A0A4S8K211_MUSBA|nr:hypothetical protein C4D60_Mb08t07020 [Musa balbisiana]